MHVWSLTSGMNAMSAHVVLSSGASSDEVMRTVQALVTRDFKISHTTIQVEAAGHQEREVHL